MEQLLEILGLQPPLWVVLLIALLNVVSMVLVISWLLRRAYGSAAKANDALTRAIRRWLGVPKIVSMSKSELNQALAVSDRLRTPARSDREYSCWVLQGASKSPSLPG